MKIAGYELKNPLALAPMAGISDKPFRILCRQFGASWTPSEMLMLNPSLANTQKSRTRKKIFGEPSPIILQILGNDPQDMAYSAIEAQNLGADFIDINMGCPARKVCKKAAGSALMQDEKKVSKILSAIVNAVNIPVTLKTRLGFNDENLNLLTIAQIAEDSGISALAIHGHTHTQMFHGNADYKLISEAKKAISIPIWANGDINSIDKAAEVLQETKADGLMIGRGAQGRPWLFAQLAAFLQNKPQPSFSWEQKGKYVLKHLAEIHSFYGDLQGTRIGRKHIKDYLKEHPKAKDFLNFALKIESSALQLEAVTEFWAKNAL